MNSEKISTLEMSITDVNSEYLGVSRILLMENAGRGLAELAWEVYNSANRSDIVIFAGKGGNGGDGMVAARHLSRNLPIRLYLVGVHKDITKRSTLQNWKILQNMQESVELVELKQVGDIKKIKINSTSLIVDSILGTGISGILREPLATLVHSIRKWQENGVIVISADTPTGIDPNTGESANVFLSPQWTGIFHKQKNGLSSKNAGKIRIIPIGVPPEAERIIGPGDLLALRSRSLWSKKGDNGRILVIGGSETYSGAPALAAMGAVQSGVDLVSIITPQKVSSAIRSYSPEFIVYDYATPHLTEEVLSTELIKQNDVIVLGPGLGQHSDTQDAVSKVMTSVKKFDKLIVIDADALKLLDMAEVTSNTILTPHAGEFAVLTDISIPSSTHEFHKRCQMVQEVSTQFPNVWVIKGHWDIVTDNSGLMKINKTGTPRMTRGGTGDVLAGLIAGFVTQAEIPFYAACIGTYINGRSGELAERNFNLSNLLRQIPVALQEGFDFIQNDSIIKTASQ
ncbi:MAG: NAD(P)H-hydrate dehydratase [Candidatus Heimdallarchaeota archaeon]|nr:MAG: NAD(P)H-hydrate dehydratase [Candidatus Heimdallarchaeota archaeon]